MTRERAIFLGPAVVPLDQLGIELAGMRLRQPGAVLELRADRSLNLRQLAPVLQVMRDSGFSSFYVLGHPVSILEAAAPQQRG